MDHDVQQPMPRTSSTFSSRSGCRHDLSRPGSRSMRSAAACGVYIGHNQTVASRMVFCHVGTPAEYQPRLRNASPLTMTNVSVGRVLSPSRSVSCPFSVVPKQRPKGGELAGSVPPANIFRIAAGRRECSTVDNIMDTIAPHVGGRRMRASSHQCTRQNARSHLCVRASS